MNFTDYLKNQKRLPRDLKGNPIGPAEIIPYKKPREPRNFETKKIERTAFNNRKPADIIIPEQDELIA